MPLARRRAARSYRWRLKAGTCHAGGDNRDANSVPQAVIERGANNDIGIGINFLTDTACCLIDLVKRQCRAADDRQQQALSPVQRHVIDQRIGNSLLGRQDRAPVAFGFARSHHRGAHALQHRPDVGKIEIDQPFLDDQIDDARDPRIENLVGKHERLGKRRLLVGDTKQVLIGDDNQRIDVFLQFDDAGFGDTHPAGAFKQKRFGDDGDGEDAEFARDARDNRCGSSARAAAHASGNEEHMGAGQLNANIIGCFLCGRFANLGF